MFFNKPKQDPKSLLEGLDKAQALLDERYEKHQITLEQYKSQAMEFMKKREKYEKLAKKQKD